MSFTFTVSDVEQREADAWIAEHIKVKHHGKFPYAGAVGGAFGWKFIPTGIGTCVSVYCMCGESKDVTDVSDW